MDWVTTSTILANLADFENQSAWKRLADQFRAPIVRFGCRLGLSPGDADDAAQESLLAFAQAYREGRYDRDRGRLRDWLFGIASRQIRSRRRTTARHEGRERNAPHEFWQAAPDADTASRIWDAEWSRAVMQASLQRVRQEVEPMTVRAFEAVVRDGRSPSEAAAELGIPVKAVYNAKYTVLKRIRELREDFER